MFYINNNLLDNIVVFLTIILIIGYLSKKNYETIIFLICISFILSFLLKNISYALIISILLTNLFISLNYFKVKEGVENIDEDRDENEDIKTEYNNEYFNYIDSYNQDIIILYL